MLNSLLQPYTKLLSVRNRTYKTAKSVMVSGVVMYRRSILASGATAWLALLLCGACNADQSTRQGRNEDAAVPAWVQSHFPGSTSNVWNTGLAGLADTSFMIGQAPDRLSTEALRNTLRVDRHATYEGGPKGYVVGALSLPCSVGPHVTTFEWCVTASLDNLAQEGNNVAIYGQALKERSAGPTWASVFEARDKSGTSDPTSALLASEIDIFASGTDRFKQRIGLNIVFGRSDESSKEITHVGHGLWFTPENNNVSSAVLDRIIDGVGNIGTAIDFSNFSIEGAALGLATSQKISFDQQSSGEYKRFLSYYDGKLRYTTPANDQAFYIEDDGTIKVRAIVSRLFTPTSSRAPCVPGQFADDANFHYVCVSAGKWKRVALSDF